jgi:dolichol-phosphate mannosyltransferase
MRGLRAWVGFRQTGVPYVRPERMFGRSTNNLLKNLGWARKAIISFSYVPIDLITGLGFAIVGLTMLGIVAQVVLRILYPSLVMSGFTTLIILILFMGGVQLLSLSMIGAYISHIYDEVKRRPPYIVESIRNHPEQHTVQIHVDANQAATAGQQASLDSRAA